MPTELSIGTAIGAELMATGTAQVIVVLRPSAAAAMSELSVSPADELDEFFTMPPASQDAALGEAFGLDVPAVTYYPNLGIMLGTVTADSVAGLAAQPLVAEVLPAPAFSLIAPIRGNDRGEEISWGLAAIAAPALWAEGLSGSGVTIGHLDSGVDGNHEALQEAVASFVEFDEVGRRTDRTDPFDSERHGTHTAGTMVGRPVGGHRIGVAPQAMLASAVVIEGGNITKRVLAGMNWVVGTGVQILNMSLGVRRYDPSFEAITAILRAQGVLPIIAIGNEGPGTSRSPGNYVDVISVGASAVNGSIWPRSSSEKFPPQQNRIVPSLVAPGVDIISARRGGQYLPLSGSSMAAPHIAGLAALLLESAPGASIAQVEQAILRSCSRGPNMTEDRSNRGLPDGVTALQALRTFVS
jgi:subtilisin